MAEKHTTTSLGGGARSDITEGVWKAVEKVRRSLSAPATVVGCGFWGKGASHACLSDLAYEVRVLVCRKDLYSVRRQ